MRTSAIVLALLLNESRAIRYRPYTDGSTPWYKQELKAPELDFPHDYPVVDRGMEYDTQYDIGVMNKLEKKMKQQVSANIWDPVIEPPRDYFVPDFGQDYDVKATLDHAGQAEVSTGNKWVGAKAPEDPPRDYYVPDFGVDTDIVTSQNNLQQTEKNLDHKIVWKSSEELRAEDALANPIDYKVQDYGLDSDIITTQKNGRDAQASLKVPNWDPTIDYVQSKEDMRLGHKHKQQHKHQHQHKIQQKSGDDPICGGLGCADNFGEYDTRAWVPLVNTKEEERLNNLPVMMRGKKVTKQTVPQSLTQARSDPICSSAGCTQFKHPKAPSEPPRDYFVPNFGEDQDIAATMRNERVASKLVNHQWNFKTEESAAEYENKARDVDYNFAPELDDDVRRTIASNKWSESNLGQWSLAQRSRPHSVQPHSRAQISRPYFVQSHSRAQISNPRHINKSQRPYLVQQQTSRPMLMQVQSDPICSSAGCDQFKHPKPAAEPPRDYFVPNFGEDQDIAATMRNERVASKLVGHQWNFKTEESAAKYENKARDVDYNFDPELDGDVRETISSDKWSESRRGKWDI